MIRPTKRKPYLCPNCGKEFVYGTSYKKHKITCDYKYSVKNKGVEDAEIVDDENDVRLAGMKAQAIRVKDKEIKLLQEMLQVPVGFKIDNDELTALIKISAGRSINYFAKAYGLTYHQMKKYLVDEELMYLFEDQYNTIVDIATDNIYQALLDGDVKISQWVLEKLPNKFKEEFELKEDAILIKVNGNSKLIEKI